MIGFCSPSFSRQSHCASFQINLPSFAYHDKHLFLLPTTSSRAIFSCLSAAHSNSFSAFHHLFYAIFQRIFAQSFGSPGCSYLPLLLATRSPLAISLSFFPSRCLFTSNANIDLHSFLSCRCFICKSYSSFSDISVSSHVSSAISTLTPTSRPFQASHCKIPSDVLRSIYHSSLHCKQLFTTLGPHKLTRMRGWSGVLYINFKLNLSKRHTIFDAHHGWESLPGMPCPTFIYRQLSFLDEEDLIVIEKHIFSETIKFLEKCSFIL